jgi:selenocysteine lyase/cysteine desulfurase
LPGAETVATPEYHFLRGGDVSGKSPLACQSYPKTAAPIPKFDVEGVRRDFPALHQLVNGKPLIWLDNAATTHKPQAVIDATSQFYGRDNSNIHRAAHALAARSTALFEADREKVRKFLGAADAKEIIFVRGTTEAINPVAQSYGRKNIGVGDEIIVSELEQHANIVPWQLLAGQVGATLRVIPINDRGELILEEFVKLLSDKTKFVSVAHVSNSLGTLNPVEQIIALAHARGVVGLGAAIDYLFKVGIPGIAAYEHALLEYATQALATIPGLRPGGTAVSKASVLAFVIPGVPNDSVARHLDKNGIAVRAGHHCALPAIRHFGLESSVRPSLAFYNTREEIDALVLALRSLKRT